MSWVPQTQIPGSAAAGGAAAAGVPWAIIIPAALSLLTSSGLFGETSTQKQRRMMEELLAMIKPQQQYLAGQFREYNPVVAKALQTQMGRTANWGWPQPAQGGG
ncbi:MAG: hypothetical protein KAV87_58200 [Desulfobacteraceae bacterium]|nr:hypothetical protein [Desulfobacteraceae bacterium]